MRLLCFKNTGFEAKSKKSLSQRFHKVWDSLSLAQKQIGLFAVAELAVLVLLGIMFALFGPVLNQILLEYADSELNLLEMTYYDKVEVMHTQVDLVSDMPELVELLTTQHPGADVHEAVQDELLYLAESFSLEVAVILDMASCNGVEGVPIRVSAYGNRTGDVVDFGDFVSPYKPCTEGLEMITVTELFSVEAFEESGAPVYRERQSEFHPVASDHMVDIEKSGLIRWVLAPIYTDEQAYNVNGNALEECTEGSGASALLLFGDVVNGKVPIVEETLERLGSGYSAVWYEGEGGEGDYTQAISYMGFLEEGYSAMLSGVSMRGAFDYMDDTFNAGGDVKHTQSAIIGHDYTFASRRLDDAPVVLVRGTSHESRDTEVWDMLIVSIIFGAVMLVTDSVILYQTIRSFVGPLEKLGRKLAVARGRHANLSESDLNSIPSQASFVKRTAASQIILVLGFVLLVVQTQQRVFAVQAEIVSRELSTFNHFFTNEIADVEMLARDFASHSGGLISEWDAVSCALASNETTTDVHHLKELYKESTKDHGIEFAVLLDSQAQIVLASSSETGDWTDDDFLQCTPFNPDGIVDDVLDGLPKEVYHTGAMLVDKFLEMFPDSDVDDYTEDYGELSSSLTITQSADDAMILWVAVPVYSEATTAAAEAECATEAQADGVLLMGRTLNGKLGLPGQVMDVFEDGYAAVYHYDEAIDDFVVVSSLLQHPGGELQTDVTIDRAILRSALAAEDYSALDESFEIDGRLYSVAVGPVLADTWTDTYGVRQVDTAATGFLVRGTTVEVTGAVKTASEVYIGVMVAGLVLCLALRVLLAYQSFLPAKTIVAGLKRAGMFKKTTDSNASSADSNASSSTDYSDVELAAEKSIRGKAYRFKASMRRLSWANWVLMALLAVSLVSLSIVIPLQDELDTKPYEEVIDLGELVNSAGVYTSQMRIERGLAGALVDGGWSTATDGTKTYLEEELYTEMMAQRAPTDEARLRFSANLALVADVAYTDSFVHDVKWVRKAVFALANDWRDDIDNFVMTHAGVAEEPVEDVVAQILVMLNALVQVSPEASSARRSTAVLRALDYAENFALVGAHEISALYYGYFIDLDQFTHFTHFVALSDGAYANFLAAAADTTTADQMALAQSTEHKQLTDEANELAYFYTDNMTVEAGFPSMDDYDGYLSLAMNDLNDVGVFAGQELTKELAAQLEGVEEKRDSLYAETLSAVVLVAFLAVSVTTVSPRHAKNNVLRAIARASQPTAAAGAPTKKRIRRSSAIQRTKSIPTRTLKALRHVRNHYIGVLFAVPALCVLGLSMSAWISAVGDYNDHNDAMDNVRQWMAVSQDLDQFVYALAEENEAASATDGLDSAGAALRSSLGAVSGQYGDDVEGVISLVVAAVDDVADYRASGYDEEFYHDNIYEPVEWLLLTVPQFAMDAKQYRILLGRANLLLSSNTLAAEQHELEAVLERGEWDGPAEFAGILQRQTLRHTFEEIGLATLGADEVELFEGIVSGSEVDNLVDWDWEVHYYPDDVVGMLPTAVDFAGNVTTVLSLWQEAEDELLARNTAYMTQLDDDATEELLRMLVPQLLCTVSMLLAGAVFYGFIYPTRGSIFHLSKGRYGQRPAADPPKASRKSTSSARVISSGGPPDLAGARSPHGPSPLASRHNTPTPSPRGAGRALRGTTAQAATDPVSTRSLRSRNHTTAAPSSSMVASPVDSSSPPGSAVVDIEAPVKSE